MRRWLRADVSRSTVFGLSVAAVVLSAGAAVAPAHETSFTYELEGRVGSRVASVGLVRGVPDSLEVQLPCEGTSEFSSLRVPLWASRRFARAVEHPIVMPRLLGSGARFVVADGVARSFHGNDLIAEGTVGQGPDCVVGFAYEAGVWSISAERVIEQRGPDPVVAELRLAGDAAGGHAAVSTRGVGSSPSAAGIALRLLALLLVVPLLARVARIRSIDPIEAGVPVGRFGVIDAAVVALLVIWTVVLPATIDEGGWRATIDAYRQTGDFSDLFYHGAAVHPTGYWHKWLLHLWVGATTVPVLERVPGLVLGVLGWWAVRDSASQLGAFRTIGGRSLVGGAFLVGYGAWGITLRPEPMVALLTAVSLGLAIRLAHGKRGWLFPIWIVILALAITVHPIGLVALAPALASWRAIRDGLRDDEMWVPAAAALSTLVALLVFIDSNLWTKAEAVSAFRSGAQSATPWSELDRYSLLERVAPPMGRLAVVLALVAVVMMLLRRRRAADPLGLPAMAVGIGLTLLTLDAAKWHWKFGTVLGLAAVALGVEVGRLRRRHAVLAGIATAGAMAWVWSDALPWGWFDLRTQVWWRGAVNLSPFDLASPLVWFVVAGIGAVGARLWFGRWRAAAPMGAVLAVGMASVIGVTTATLVVDAVRTPGWTFTSQNVGALLGRADCGVAEELLVPVGGSLRSLQAAPELDGDSEGGPGLASPGFVDALGVAGPPPLPLEDGGSSWFDVPPSTRVFAFAASTTQAPSINAEWVWQGDLDRIETSVGLVQAVHPDWTLVEFVPPSGASQVRLRARGTDAAITAPGTMDLEPLSSSNAVAMVTPELLQFSPCSDVPVPEGGLLEPSALFVVAGRPGHAFQDPYILAGTPDRYFSMPISIAAGDFPITILASQEHLTGQPSRATATARLIDASGR